MVIKADLFSSGGLTIDSVTARARDWASLARKLGEGRPLEQAAAVCGIPLDEAREWAKLQLKASPDEDVALLFASHDAMQSGLAALKRLTNAARTIINVTPPAKDGAKTPPRRLEPLPDLEIQLHAAKALVDFAVKIRTKIRPDGITLPGARGASARLNKDGSVQLDLWDGKGPWDVETPK